MECGCTLAQKCTCALENLWQDGTHGENNRNFFVWKVPTANAHVPYNWDKSEKQRKIPPWGKSLNGGGRWGGQKGKGTPWSLVGCSTHPMLALKCALNICETSII